MPYKVFKTGPPDKPYCVYKHDEAGRAVGESLGCHPSPEDAEKQIAAIGARTHMNQAIRRKAGRG
jgi:hypothetical protein